MVLMELTEIQTQHFTNFTELVLVVPFRKALQVNTTQAFASAFGVCILDVLDYRSTSKTKVLRSFGGNDLNGSGRVNITGILPFTFGSSTALQSLWFYIPSNYAAGSRFDLYGITSSQVTGA